MLMADEAGTTVDRRVVLRGALVCAAVFAGLGVVRFFVSPPLIGDEPGELFALVVCVAAGVVSGAGRPSGFRDAAIGAVVAYLALGLVANLFSDLGYEELFQMGTGVAGVVGCAIALASTRPPAPVAAPSFPAGAYGAPQWQGAPPPGGPSTNGFAIASLVLGILGFSVLAIVFGHIGASQVKRSGGYQTGRGMAIAGLVLGYLWLLLSIGFFVALAIAASSET